MFTLKFLKVLLLTVLFLYPLACDEAERRESRHEDVLEETVEPPGRLSEPVSPDDTLSIYCIDVGQGDATLIVSPSGQTALIDAGKNGRGNREVLPFLHDLGITCLDIVVATHYHEDHIGGIDEVIRGLTLDSVGVVCDRGWGYHGATYDSLVAAAGSKRTAIEDGDTIPLGAGVSLISVAVNGNGQLTPDFSDGSHDENDLGVALKLTCGRFDFFVAGDLSGKNISSYNDIETSVAPEVGQVEVFQVNHHGSKYSNNQCFVDSLQPIVSILSVGKNTYGHPNSGVVSRLEAVSEGIYQTEDADGNLIDGDITIKVCSDSFWVNDDPYQCHTAP